MSAPLTIKDGQAVSLTETQEGQMLVALDRANGVYRFIDVDPALLGESGTLASSAATAQTLDVYLPNRAIGGAVGVKITPTFAGATPENPGTVTITATPIIAPHGAAAILATNITATSLVSAGALTSAATYYYDVSNIASGLPFFGVRLTLTYPNWHVTNKTLSTVATLVAA